MFRKRILGRKSNSGYEEVHNSCVVRFLDDTEPMTVTFQKDTTGQYLIDHVCSTLDLAERDYFGLRYVDSEKQRHWLDPTRSAYRQLKSVQPMMLCFRVKFYPSEPLKLKEEITKYHLFLQLSRDFHHGRLLCSQSEANRLAAFLIQAEVGDYSTCSSSGSDGEDSSYVLEVKNLPKQIQKQEDKVAEIHKTLSGMTAVEAEEKFIEMASRLDTYGVDPHPIKDQNGNMSYLGITRVGIVTFQGNKRTHLFHWQQILKLDYEGKNFIIQVMPTEEKENTEPLNARKPKKQSHSFKCSSSNACKHLWKCAVQQQYFFTLKSSSAAPKVKAGGGLFRRPSKYRFSGHCESEVLEESAVITRPPPSFKRSTSNPQFLQMLDKLGSGSLPSSFCSATKENRCNVTLEPQRSGSMDQGMSSILEKVEEKAAQEPPIQVFDGNYEPLVSPETEELPVFPGTDESTVEEDSGVDLSSHCDVSLSSIQAPLTELEFSELAAADLDAQIKELQMELDKCKNPFTTSNTSQTLLQQQEEEEEPILELENKDVLKTTPTFDAITPNGSTHPKKMEPANDAISSSFAWISWNNILFSFLVFFVLLLILTVLFFETGLSIPLVSALRRWPEVRRFRSRIYRPLKAAVAQYFRW